MPKISIIVPVYNSEKYLEECLNSLINQTYRHIEVLLIDDGSTDSSGNICDRYADKDKRVAVYHNNNQGPSYSRNFGLKKATGDYVTFVDCDDWIDSNAIDTIIAEIESEEADILFFNLRKVVGNSIEEYKMFDRKKIVFFKEEKTKLENILLIPEKYTDKSIVGLAGSVCKLYKKEIIAKCEFPHSFDYSEDYCFIAQAIKNSEKIVYIDEILYNYRIHKGSLSHNLNGKLVEKNAKFVNWFLNFYKDDKDYKILNEFVYKNYCLITSITIVDKKLNWEQKKDERNKFLKSIKFQYDFSRIDLYCKNKNLRLEWILIHKQMFGLVYIFNELVRIKNGD